MKTVQPLTTRIISLLLIAGLLSACITTSSNAPISAAADEEIAAQNTKLGIAYLRQGDFQTARVKLERATRLDPRASLAHWTLALVYERLDDLVGAEQYYQKAYKLAPRDPDVLNSLATFTCLRKGDVDGALGYFDKALSIPVSEQYSNKAMLNTNAGVCAKREDLAKAESYLRAALAEDNRFVDALLQLSDVSFQRKNWLQARAFLERYLAAAPVSPGALWLGVQIEKEMGGAREAYQYSEQLKRDFPASVETRRLLELERDAG